MIINKYCNSLYCIEHRHRDKKQVEGSLYSISFETISFVLYFKANMSLVWGGRANVDRL